MILQFIEKYGNVYTSMARDRFDQEPRRERPPVSAAQMVAFLFESNARHIRANRHLPLESLLPDITVQVQHIKDKELPDAYATFVGIAMQRQVGSLPITRREESVAASDDRVLRSIGGIIKQEIVTRYLDEGKEALNPERVYGDMAVDMGMAYYGPSARKEVVEANVLSKYPQFRDREPGHPTAHLNGVRAELRRQMYDAEMDLLYDRAFEYGDRILRRPEFIDYVAFPVPQQ